MAGARTFRLATPTDAPAIVAIYGPVVAGTTISFEEQAPGPDAIAARITAAGWWWPWIVATNAKNDIEGFAYGSTHRERASYRWSADVSIYVAPSAHRRGIGRALYERLFRILAAQNYYHAFAGITLPNDASVGLHRSLGFTPVGIYRHVGFKFDAWRDTSWWQRPLRPLDVPPAEPVSLASLDGSVREALLR